VEISAWFVTSDYAEFLRLREDVLLRLLEIVEAAGATLAYPTRTVRAEAG
jgi:MscS family membrane protein